MTVARSDGASAQRSLFAECGIETDVGVGAVTSENGGTATFRVRLRSQPLHPVMVPVSNGVDAGSIDVATPSATSVWFSTSDWDQWQTIELIGLEDGLVRDNVDYSVALGPPASTDVVYGGSAGTPSALSGRSIPQHSASVGFQN